MMFDALTFEDILQEERERLREVNHCHGPGKGHPCQTGTKTKATAKPKVKRLWPFGVALTRTPKRTWPKLTSSGQFVRETWSDVARAAALASRRAGAQLLGGLEKNRKDRERAAAKAQPKGKGSSTSKSDADIQAKMDAINTERNTLMGRQLSPAEQARADQLDSQWDALKKQKGQGGAKGSAKPKVDTTEIDSKIRASADSLRALADRVGTESGEYRKAYAAHQSLQDQKRDALGQPKSVKAPTKPKAEPKPKAAAPPKVKPKVVSKNAGHYQR